MTLTPSTEKFIASWGEMASKWCVNRTVAEVHALFYLSAEPLNADDVAGALSFSRSNVSAGMRELENKGLITPVHVRGDRKQYYESTKDPWEAFRLILDDHKRRVIDPAVGMFRTCVEEQARTAPEDPYTLERMRGVISFFDAINPLYNEIRRLPGSPIQNLFMVAAKIREFTG
jgi:DNA-binding transcriptional regulator GbsR (MarR family)